MRQSRPFRFKRFTVNQRRSAMKVGTDGTLLGAWCTVDGTATRALDVGTGTGLIALMLAQRGEGLGLGVDCVERNPGAVEDARENIAASPWRERIRLYSTRIQDFTPPHKYGLIVCNPPYFSSCLLPPERGRTIARHDVGLTRGELVASCAAVCEKSGRLAVVVPFEQAGEYIVECDLNRFSLSRRTDVHTRAGTPPKRSLLEFVYDTGPIPAPAADHLTLENAPMVPTAQYKALTRDFYLRF